MGKKDFILRLLYFVLSFTFVGLEAEGAESWVARARKVGQSETPAAREGALRSLRKHKNLSAKLVKALDTSNRALALDVIAALPLKSLLPELQARVSSDPDGFLILALSSLIDETNKDSVLKTYTEALNDSDRLSPGAIVAILEPLGRLGQPIENEIALKLWSHPYPEVRSSLLSYIRVTALTHKKRDYDAIALKGLRASEFQLRLQTISFLNELTTAGSTPLLKVSELEKHCQKERSVRIKSQCLSFLRRGQT